MTAILALDTATGPCSVALWRNGSIAAYLENPRPASQSALLMPMVEQALAEVGIGYSDLAAVAATIGPGSFTGIRVGLAAARGICFASKIKGLGFTTLQTLAFAARQDAARILAILNAGKNEVYYQLFEASPMRPLSTPMLGKMEEAMAMATDATIIGNTGSSPRHPRADALAMLAAAQADAAQPLSPFYIRPPDAKPSQKT